MDILPDIFRAHPIMVEKDLRDSRECFDYIQSVKLHQSIVPLEHFCAGFLQEWDPEFPLGCRESAERKL